MVKMRILFLFGVRRYHVYYRIFSTIPGFYPLDATSILPVVTIKMSPDISRCPLWEKGENSPVENYCRRLLAYTILEWKVNVWDSRSLVFCPQQWLFLTIFTLVQHLALFLCLIPLSAKVPTLYLSQNFLLSFHSCLTALSYFLFSDLSFFFPPIILSANLFFLILDLKSDIRQEYSTAFLKNSHWYSLFSIVISVLTII